MYALIVAAGSGTRMGLKIPKQFLPLRGKPILYYTIQAFLQYADEMNIVLVTNPVNNIYFTEVLKLFSSNRNIQIVHGGSTRFESVKNGLNLIPDNDIVFIHDGVRPFVHAKLISRCYEMALLHGNAIPCLPITDSIRIIKGNENLVVDRSILRAIQTPQTFKSELIKEAYKQAKHNQYTDDATVLEDSGIAIHLCQGEEGNIKITTPLDLQLAEILF